MSSGIEAYRRRPHRRKNNNNGDRMDVSGEELSASVVSRVSTATPPPPWAATGDLSVSALVEDDLGDAPFYPLHKTTELPTTNAQHQHPHDATTLSGVSALTSGTAYEPSHMAGEMPPSIRSPPPVVNSPAMFQQQVRTPTEDSVGSSSATNATTRKLFPQQVEVSREMNDASTHNSDHQLSSSSHLQSHQHHTMKQQPDVDDTSVLSKGASKSDKTRETMLATTSSNNGNSSSHDGGQLPIHSFEMSPSTIRAPPNSFHHTTTMNDVSPPPVVPSSMNGNNEGVTPAAAHHATSSMSTTPTNTTPIFSPHRFKVPSASKQQKEIALAQLEGVVLGGPQHSARHVQSPFVVAGVQPPSQNATILQHQQQSPSMLQRASPSPSPQHPQRAIIPNVAASWGSASSTTSNSVSPNIKWQAALSGAEAQRDESVGQPSGRRKESRDPHSCDAASTSLEPHHQRRRATQHLSGETSRPAAVDGSGMTTIEAPNDPKRSSSSPAPVASYPHPQAPLSFPNLDARSQQLAEPHQATPLAKQRFATKDLPKPTQRHIDVAANNDQQVAVDDGNALVHTPHGGSLVDFDSSAEPQLQPTRPTTTHANDDNSASRERSPAVDEQGVVSDGRLAVPRQGSPPRQHPSSDFVGVNGTLMRALARLDSSLKINIMPLAIAGSPGGQDAGEQRYQQRIMDRNVAAIASEQEERLDARSTYDEHHHHHGHHLDHQPAPLATSTLVEHDSAGSSPSPSIVVEAAPMESLPPNSSFGSSHPYGAPHPAETSAVGIVVEAPYPRTSCSPHLVDHDLPRQRGSEMSPGPAGLRSSSEEARMGGGGGFYDDLMVGEQRSHPSANAWEALINDDLGPEFTPVDHRTNNKRTLESSPSPAAMHTSRLTNVVDVSHHSTSHGHPAHPRRRSISKMMQGHEATAGVGLGIPQCPAANGPGGRRRHQPFQGGGGVGSAHSTVNTSIHSDKNASVVMDHQPALHVNPPPVAAQHSASAATRSPSLGGLGSGPTPVSPPRRVTTAHVHDTPALSLPRSQHIEGTDHRDHGVIQHSHQLSPEAASGTLLFALGNTDRSASDSSNPTRRGRSSSVMSDRLVADQHAWQEAQGKRGSCPAEEHDDEESE